MQFSLLPPAYVVRREGTVFTGVCLSTGGVPGPPRGVPRSRYPPGGYPGQVPPPPRGGGGGGGGGPGTPRGGSGYPPLGGVPGPGYPPWGGTRVRYPPGGYPGLGTPPGGGGPGTPPGRVPRSGYPPGGSGYPPGWGGTWVRYTPRGGVPRSGYPPGGSGYPPGGGVPGSGTPPGEGGTQVQVPPPGGVPGSGTPPGRGVPRSGYPPGGTRVRYPPGGVPGSGTPPGVPRSGYPPRGGYLTRVGQQKEYSLHGGRYASCVHAGGLSCVLLSLFNLQLFSINKLRFGCVCTPLGYILKVIPFIRINIAGRSMQFCTYLLQQGGCITFVKSFKEHGMFKSSLKRFSSHIQCHSNLNNPYSLSEFTQNSRESRTSSSQLTASVRRQIRLVRSHFLGGAETRRGT